MMRRIRRMGAMVALGALTLGGLSACGSSGTTAKAPSAAGSVRGQTINVAIAYPAPKAMLARFTAETGVKVNWNYLQFDDLQTKIAAAAEAHSYFADVADVDWSKVGEYYQTKWFVPLNRYFDPTSLSGQYPQLASFVRDGKLMGMPMDGSLLVTTANEKDFRAAGVHGDPTTFGAYVADLHKVAAKGTVPNPLDIPFAAAEGLSTYWYELTAAYGGQILNSAYQPQFTSPTSPGYKALAWMVSAYRSGLVPKANLDEQDYQAFAADMAHDRTASVFSDYSGTLGTIYNVHSQSTVVGQVRYIPTPGLTGAAPNLGNPDGIGIPTEAKHVAAAVAFIKWMEQPANQAAFAGAKSSADIISGFPLPSNRGGLADLVASHKVPGAATLTALLEHHARPIFPAGAPPWYGQFSNSVYTNIHSAAAGSESVASAVKAIDSTVTGLGG